MLPPQDGTSPYMGAIVGRVANRIAGAQFELDGETYKLAANNGPNCLHGGKVGYDKVLWAAERLEGEGGEQGEAVCLTYTSPDGEEGFPGTVRLAVTYRLTPANELVTVMEATTGAWFGGGSEGRWGGGADGGGEEGREILLAPHAALFPSVPNIATCLLSPAPAPTPPPRPTQTVRPRSTWPSTPTSTLRGRGRGGSRAGATAPSWGTCSPSTQTTSRR